MELENEPPSPERPTTLQDLPPLPPPPANTGEGNTDTDTKPDLSKLGTDIKKEGGQARGIKPFYGFDGVPSFPPKWTYPSQAAVSLPPIILYRSEGVQGDQWLIPWIGG